MLQRNQERMSLLRITQVYELAGEARALLEEYYDAMHVQKQDARELVQAWLADQEVELWIAWLGDEPVGCVMLRHGVPFEGAGECKRLYVRPAARGRGAAAALMQQMEATAAQNGLRWVYLDTNETFAASVHLYRSRGYQPCERYNDNPQATMFFRKQMFAGVSSRDEQGVAL